MNLRCKFDKKILHIRSYDILKKIDEFGDGSEWTLSKYLTHANRTFNLIN